MKAKNNSKHKTTINIYIKTGIKAINELKNSNPITKLAASIKIKFSIVQLLTLIPPAFHPSQLMTNKIGSINAQKYINMRAFFDFVI
jgi:hypothetical protein